MKQTTFPRYPRPTTSLARTLEGYDTGQLLSVLEAIGDIFRRRGLQLTFTAATPQPCQAVDPGEPPLFVR